MATINEQFIQVKTKANFESRLSAGDIKDTSIAFIEDTNEIWTQGHYYSCVPLAGGTTGQVLTKTPNGVAWQEDKDTTYSKATSSTDGLMSKEDKAKLDSIQGGDKPYTLPTANNTTLGGIKTGYTSSNGNYAVKVDSSGNAYTQLGVSIVKCTQGEYDELTPDDNTIYYIIP